MLVLNIRDKLEKKKLVSRSYIIVVKSVNTNKDQPELFTVRKSKKYGLMFSGEYYEEENEQIPNTSTSSPF